MSILGAISDPRLPLGSFLAQPGKLTLTSYVAGSSLPKALMGATPGDAGERWEKLPITWPDQAHFNTVNAPHRSACEAPRLTPDAHYDRAKYRHCSLAPD